MQGGFWREETGATFLLKVNMRAPPEAVRAQIQQLLVDRMVRKEQLHFSFSAIGWQQLVQGEENARGGEGHSDELRRPRRGERRPENSLGRFPHKCPAFR